MADVLIVAHDSIPIRELQASLEREGYEVTVAASMLAALPTLYITPNALVVVISAPAQAADTSDMDLLMLAGADPSWLGRHTFISLRAGEVARFRLPPIHTSSRAPLSAIHDGLSVGTV